MKRVATASQTVGPFFHFGLERPGWNDLASAGAAGQRIRIEGRVLDGDGAPVPDALLEIWQANAAGKYDHPEDTQDKKLDPKFRGFGRACTDVEGRYSFITVLPGQAPGRGNALQAPHINMTVFARGLLKHLVTRIYFADQAAANESDPVLAGIDDPAMRSTLLAKPAGGDGVYRFDVILQGPGETVFFEI
jgi:protocatechuate 3,4-dioxygenase, alpha subunit